VHRFLISTLLDNLHLDVSLVTLYGSLTAGANLLMLVFWGKLADRIGNRPILLTVGILAAVMPLFWLGVGGQATDLWLWLPLIHLFTGATWAAIDLCSNNIQMTVAPAKSQAVYFAIASAVAGVTGALGTAAGGFLAQLSSLGGLPGLFALSAVLRLLALLPLLLVQEERSQSLIKLWRETKLAVNFFRSKSIPTSEP
jgi:MFS family permease